MGPPIDEQFYRMPESKGIIITTITKCHPKRRHDESNHSAITEQLTLSCASSSFPGNVLRPGHTIVD